MTEHVEQRTGTSRLASCLPWLGLALIALFSLAPLLGERQPVTWIQPYSSSWAAICASAAVAAIMLAAICLGVWFSRAGDPSAIAAAQFCFAMAGLMTAWHWVWRDSLPELGEWQAKLYLDILNHRGDAPHQFRPLGYGFTRCLEWFMGSWTFSFLAYRWFFTYWFLWLWYRFSRAWLSADQSLLPMNLLLVLYPLSTWYYYGQLTDPLSYTLFALALIYTVEDRWLLLAYRWPWASLPRRRSC